MSKAGYFTATTKSRSDIYTSREKGQADGQNDDRIRVADTKSRGARISRCVGGSEDHCNTTAIDAVVLCQPPAGELCTIEFLKG